MTLAKLLEQTREGGEMLREVRERARPACVAAVRKLEASLVEALGGERLRGLPQLWPDQGQKPPPGSERYCAASARGKKIDGFVGEKSMLVVADDGHLKIAVGFPFPNEDVGVVDRPVEDSELLAEDAEDVPRAVEEALRRHVANTAARTERYQHLLDLAGKLEAALG